MRADHQSVANVYIGYDTREREAYEVAHYTLARAASCPLRITPLRLHQLEEQGLYDRPRSRRKKAMWDILSQAPMSTEFANSRFLVPFLAQTGWAAFMDCDIIARGDVAELFALADPQYAVMVVKHPPLEGSTSKMDGQPQLPYARKNWSSVMLFNCDHPANRRLTLKIVNREPGRLLHRFFWLHDDEIGALPLAWNWLVNVSPCPADWKVAHFTLGGPWLAGWSPQNHDDLWLSASADFRTGSGGSLPRAGKAVA